jgi:uncharacterized hydrophobic protein (TIGR00271 family)
MFKLLRIFMLGDEREDFQSVLDNIYKGVVFRGTNLWILVFAIFIASLGLNVNSTAVIIGAMLISPLMGPIMGAGFSLAVNDVALLRKSVYNLAIATGAGLATSTLYFSVTPLSEAHSEILARTSPNIYDVLIAFFGGLAAILATTSKLKGNVIPGAAIATALMPPLCTAGYGIATWQLNYFYGAFYLFVINAVFISLATMITARLMGYPYIAIPDKRLERRTKRIIFAITLLTLVPSIYSGYDIVMKNRFTARANAFIDHESNIPNALLYKRAVDAENRRIRLDYAGQDLPDSLFEEMRAKLAEYDLSDATLDVKVGLRIKSTSDKPILQEQRTDELTLGLKAAIQEKDLQLARLRTELDSLRQIDKLNRSLYRELKSLYPDIEALAAHPAVKVRDSLEQTVYLCAISTKKRLTPEDRNRIEAWLGTRLSTTSVELVVY